MAPATSNAALSRAHSASSSEPVIWTLDVYVYAYTFSGQVTQELMGFAEPVGLCSDPSGDIYVVDAARQLIYVYAPGQYLPYYIYDDLGQAPSSCAFDPSTGDLAVANAANVTVFPPASGQPVVYKSQKMGKYYFLGYDKSGNLYVDGSSAGHFALAELPAGGTHLIRISLSNLGAGKHRAAGLVWDGKDVAVADSQSNVIYRIAISGTSGTVLNTWHISHWRLHYNAVFAIDGKRLIFPRRDEVVFFRYPPTGRALNSFSAHVTTQLVIAPEVIN